MDKLKKLGKLVVLRKLYLVGNKFNIIQGTARVQKIRQLKLDGPVANIDRNQTDSGFKLIKSHDTLMLIKNKLKKN